MEFRISVDIAASPHTVWQVMSDVERWHEWTESVRSVRLFGTGPLAVGRRALIRQPKFPPAVWTVTEFTPDHGFVWKSGLPGMWVFGHHFVEAIPDGTRATLRLDYHGALARLLGRMTADLTNRYLEYEAAGLKRRSEANQQAARASAPSRR
jgi:hypothetical protein